MKNTVRNTDPQQVIKNINVFPKKEVPQAIGQSPIVEAGDSVLEVVLGL